MMRTTMMILALLITFCAAWPIHEVFSVNIDVYKLRAVPEFIGQLSDELGESLTCENCPGLSFGTACHGKCKTQSESIVKLDRRHRRRRHTIDI